MVKADILTKDFIFTNSETYSCIGMIYGILLYSDNTFTLHK